MQFNDFISPKASLMPGIAGAAVVLVTNLLWLAFAWPQKWIALILSLALAAIVFVKYALPNVEKSIYIILNAFIIFSIALGFNYLGYRNFIKSNDEDSFAISMSAGFNDGKLGFEINDQNLDSKRKFFDDWFHTSRFKN